MENSESTEPIEFIPSSSRIIGGTTVRTDSTGRSHPYPAYVQIRVSRINVLFQRTSSFTCGGVIVHAWPKLPSVGWPAGFWVLTAAHCLDPGSTYAINLWTGQGSQPNAAVSQLPTGVTSSNNAPGWTQVGPRRIRIYSHPLFDRKSLDHDIALIRVLLPDSADLPASLTPPQSLPILDIMDPTNISSAIPTLKMIGFGMTERPPKGTVSNTLQEADAKRHQSSLPGKISVAGVADASSPSAGSATVTTCQGDSGGPLLRDGGRIVSGALCCGFCAVQDVADQELRNYPSFYSAVHPYIDPPQGTFFTMGLPQTSPWQRGILDFVQGASPTIIRTNTVITPTPTPSTTQAEEIGNDWVEMPVAVSFWSRWLRLILYYVEGAIIPIIATIVAVVIIAVLLTRHRRGSSSRGSGGRGGGSGIRVSTEKGRVGVGEGRGQVAE